MNQIISFGIVFCLFLLETGIDLWYNTGEHLPANRCTTTTTTTTDMMFANLQNLNSDSSKGIEKEEEEGPFLQFN